MKNQIWKKNNLNDKVPYFLSFVALTLSTIIVFQNDILIALSRKNIQQNEENIEGGEKTFKELQKINKNLDKER